MRLPHHTSLWSSWSSLITGVLAVGMVLFFSGLVRASVDTDLGPDRPSLSLSDAENNLIVPDEVAIAVADLEAGMAQLSQLQNEQGLKLFAGANVGSTTDTSLIVDRNYTTYDLRVGLRYPILGRAAAEQRGVTEAETGVHEKEQRLSLARRQSLSLLRRQYISCWSTQEKLKLTRAFLSGEAQQTELLNRRQKSGYLLTADYLEFLTAFDLARRNQANLTATNRLSRNFIQRLTGFSTDFLAVSPTLPFPCLEKEKLRDAVISEYPSIALLRHRLHGLELQSELAGKGGASGNLDLYSASGNDDSRNAAEYSVGVGLAVELPVGLLTSRERPAEQTARAMVVKCRHELALETAATWAQAEEALALFEASRTDLVFAGQRLRAATESVRENTLRTAMEGDSLERVQKSRFAYYQVALDFIESQARQWNLQVTLLEYCPNNREVVLTQKAASAAVDASLLLAVATDLNTAATAAAMQSGHRLNGFYVWQSRQLQDQAADNPAFWSGLQSSGYSRILLSLDQKQISMLQDPVARAAFAVWLRQVQRTGMRLELLLGEPTWVLPKNRVKLMQLILDLHDLPFTGLHLDIEPDQLSKETIRTIDVRKEWLTTIQAARNISPWPLGVSIHPRYFDPEKGWRDLGPSLTRIGVLEVALMIYVTDAKKVSAQASRIMEALPQLRFSVSQSVEPSLSSQESHSRVGQHRFLEHMEQLNSLMPHPNFLGLIVQDWHHWQDMKP